MNVYEIVTERILEQMQKGIVPWQRPWHGVNGLAISYTSRKPYSFLNQLLLGRPGEWLTFNQIVSLGGKLKKGAKSSMVTFFEESSKPAASSTIATDVDADADEEAASDKGSYRRFILRYYRVFHIDDCEGIPSKIKEEPMRQTEPVSAAEDAIKNYLAREVALRFQSCRSNRAFYSPSEDSVTVPLIGQYDLSEQYYATAFHELVHSTGHPSRLDRKAGMVSHFGSEDYSKEELTAEMGSAMFCGLLGLDCEKAFLNTVAYLQGWLKVLKKDSRMIVFAASGAEKAAKYILGVKEFQTV